MDWPKANGREVLTPAFSTARTESHSPGGWRFRRCRRCLQRKPAAPSASNRAGHMRGAPPAPSRILPAQRSDGRSNRRTVWPALRMRVCSFHHILFHPLQIVPTRVHADDFFDGVLNVFLGRKPVASNRSELMRSLRGSFEGVTMMSALTCFAAILASSRMEMLSQPELSTPVCS